MNPISAATWFWKALRGNSVTFAVLLACALLGVSVLRLVKEGLYAVGTPWWLVLIIPSVLIGVLAKKEAVWIPDEGLRRRWARGLVIGSVVLSVLMAFFKPTPASPPADQGRQSTSDIAEPPSAPASIRPRGPSGK